MKVCQINRIGKSENFKIVLDNNFSIPLSMQTIYKNKIEVGSDLEQEELTKLHIENEKDIAFDRAIKLISKVSKTQKEIALYLNQKGYLPEVVQFVIEKLLSYKYINDETYAKDYVLCNKTIKGKRMISFQLSQKGISKDVIERVLNDFDETDTALNIAKKYMKNKDYDYKNKQKLYGYLISKGFSYSTSSDVVSELFSRSE